MSTDTFDPANAERDLAMLHLLRSARAGLITDPLMGTACLVNGSAHFEVACALEAVPDLFRAWGRRLESVGRFYYVGARYCHTTGRTHVEAFVQMEHVPALLALPLDPSPEDEVEQRRRLPPIVEHPGLPGVAVGADEL